MLPDSYDVTSATKSAFSGVFKIVNLPQFCKSVLITSKAIFPPCSFFTYIDFPNANFSEKFCEIGGFCCAGRATAVSKAIGNQRRKRAKVVKVIFLPAVRQRIVIRNGAAGLLANDLDDYSLV